jgi:hypothetical protein
LTIFVDHLSTGESTGRKPFLSGVTDPRDNNWTTHEEYRDGRNHPGARHPGARRAVRVLPARLPKRGDGVTSWHYRCGHRHGTVVTDVPHDRTDRADAMITPFRPCLADGRAELAGVFDRLPDLTLAAVPLGSAGLLLGDRIGDTTLIDHGEREPTTVAAFVWLATGRRLGALASISRIPERGFRTLPRGTGQQLDHLDEAVPGELVVAVRGPGRYEQQLRLVHRRA